jgi:hypothetical protein
MTTALAIPRTAAPAPVRQQPAPTTKRQRTKLTVLATDEAPAREAKVSRLPKPATPTPLEQQAARLGLPPTLFGFTPNERSYWAEPGLPWLTPEMYNDFEQMPLDYRGFRALLCLGDIEGDHMAPRFPRGCTVQTMPVYDKANLVVGRVYTYCYLDQQTQEWAYEMGRLVKIGGNFLEVKADNHPTPSLWLLRDEPEQAVWDVREVTHYAAYPDLDILPSAG